MKTILFVMTVVIGLGAHAQELRTDVDAEKQRIANTVTHEEVVNALACVEDERLEGCAMNQQNVRKFLVVLNKALYISRYSADDKYLIEVGIDTLEKLEKNFHIGVPSFY